jgi:hypothetical protein
MLHKAQEGRKTFQWNVFRREPSQGVPCGYLYKFIYRRGEANFAPTYNSLAY